MLLLNAPAPQLEPDMPKALFPPPTPRVFELNEKISIAVSN